MTALADTIAALFASGRILDLLVAGMVLEGAALVAHHRVTGRGIRPARLLPNLLAGICLVFAMRLGLAGAWWGWVSLALLGALVGHVTDVARAWR